MSNNDINLTDAEWEAKFNGPRDRLLKEIFGDTQCPAADISPKVAIKDKNWEKKEDFMASDHPRIYKNMNSDFRGVAEWNEQMRSAGRVTTVIRDEQLADLKEKPEPAK